MNIAHEEYGIVIVGHGTREAEGVREFERLVELIRGRSNGHVVTCGFLELAQPTIAEAIRANIEAGSRRVVVVPGLLLAAGHAKEDIPAEIEAVRKEFPQIVFHYAAPLGLHPLALEVIAEKITEAEIRSAKTVPRGETCLVVVGRGSSDSDATSEVSKLAQILKDTMGFGASLACFCAVAKPNVPDGLALAAQTDFSRVVVMPFILSTGFVVKQIHSACDDLAANHPGIEVLKCAHLGPDERIAAAFLERAAECIGGK